MSQSASVLLMGHPNVGKSALFNRLAGASIAESNYPGTTVEYTKSQLRLNNEPVPIIDVPGTFSLEPKDRAESVAIGFLESEVNPTVVCVIDATRIERGLNLVLEILDRGYEVVIALNMWDEARRKGVDIDADMLADRLGVPVVQTVATEGDGVDDLRSILDRANSSSLASITDRLPSKVHDDSIMTGDEPAARWDIVDTIVESVVTYQETDPSLSDQLGQLTIAPKTGLPFAIAVLYGVWAFFSSVAGFFTDGYFVPLFDDHWLPWIQSAFPAEGSWLYFLLVGDPTAVNSFEAFGVLTSGLFVAVGVVLPAILALYLVLALLEDSGYIARLAVLLDAAFHRIGLHGYAIVPMVLSFGCNVPGVAATRTLETNKQRFLTMTLLSVFIPCGAQLGVMLSLIPQYAGYILLYLLVGFFVFGAVLNRIVPGSAPEVAVDIPPLRRPRLANVIMKLSVRIRGFMMSAVPFVLAGVGIVNLLYLGGAVDWLATVFQPVLSGWFGVPEETVPALIAGFMRKDLAIAQLSAVSMSPFQTVMSVVMVSIYFPCVATFAMLIKEGRTSGGIIRAVGGALATLVAALFIWGGLLRVIGIILGVA